MTEQESLIWDITRSDNLAFLNYLPALADRSTLMGAASSLNGLGVSFDLMPAVEYLAYFGQAAQSRPPMGPAVGTGAALANWTSDNLLFKDQEKCRAELRKLVLDTVPRHLLVPMQDANRSIRARSTEFILTALRENLGVLSKEDIDFLMRELTTPHQPGTSAATFVANWQASARDLDRAGQGLPQTMATDTLQKCFGPEFNSCWVKFVQDFPLIAHRTVARLCVAIITFAKDSLPLLATHSAIGMSAVIDQTGMMAKMQAQIDQLQLQALSASKDNRKRSQAPSDRPSKQPRGTVLSARPFCWSHGPQGHLGCDCTDKLPGHKAEATWGNQKGSKWKELFARRGWATA